MCNKYNTTVKTIFFHSSLQASLLQNLFKLLSFKTSSILLCLQASNFCFFRKSSTNFCNKFFAARIAVVLISSSEPSNSAFKPGGTQFVFIKSKTNTAYSIFYSTTNDHNLIKSPITFIGNNLRTECSHLHSVSNCWCTRGIRQVHT